METFLIISEYLVMDLHMERKKKWIKDTNTIKVLLSFYYISDT